MTTQLVQKIKQDTREKFEEFRQRSVEQARENFTRLPGYLIEHVFGISQPEEHSKNKNFTPFDEATRKKIGEGFNEQDAPKLDETRTELQALQSQVNFVRKEEAAAQEYFKKKDEERKKLQMEDDERHNYEQVQKAQLNSGSSEPSTKAQRGTQARKKPAETAENRASFGKQ